MAEYTRGCAEVKADVCVIILTSAIKLMFRSCVLMNPWCWSSRHIWVILSMSLEREAMCGFIQRENFVLIQHMKMKEEHNHTQKQINKSLLLNSSDQRRYKL